MRPTTLEVATICRRCAHDHDWHTHHRPGTDCARCPCPHFTRWRWW